jgi:hypothetical protein
MATLGIENPDSFRTGAIYTPFHIYFRPIRDAILLGMHISKYTAIAHGSVGGNLIGHDEPVSTDFPSLLFFLAG